MGDTSNDHRSNNAKPYINVGWGMRGALVKLIKRSSRAQIANLSVPQKRLIERCGAGLLTHCD
jgi:hypothetical protein